MPLLRFIRQSRQASLVQKNRRFYTPCGFVSVSINLSIGFTLLLACLLSADIASQHIVFLHQQIFVHINQFWHAIFEIFRLYGMK
jgi:hypothetical protein